MLTPALPSFVGRAMENQPPASRVKKEGLKLSLCLHVSTMHMQGKPPVADCEPGAKNLQSLAERGFFGISSAAGAVTCLWF